MSGHREHILTSKLRRVYDYLFDMGESDPSFDVSDKMPAGKNRKRAVVYHYAGKRANPFSFIVNSGERKDYHLFYIRHPGKQDLNVVREYFDEDKIYVNNAGEITVHIHDLVDAENIWKVVKRVQLQ